jgi:uncharacterized protein YcbK (DUF882 family)
MNRRKFLQSASIISAGLLLPKISFGAQSQIKPERKLQLLNCHTGEKFNRVYWIKGEYDPCALKEIDHILRDHYTKDQIPIDIKLIEGIHNFSTNLNTNHPLEIVSGYRCEATNKRLRRNSRHVAQNSYHMYGRAVDLRVARLPIRYLSRAAKSIRLGGVGTYSRFIHIDTGPIRYWGRNL